MSLRVVFEIYEIHKKFVIASDFEKAAWQSIFRKAAAFDILRNLKNE